MVVVEEAIFHNNFFLYFQTGTYFTFTFYHLFFTLKLLNSSDTCVRLFNVIAYSSWGRRNKTRKNRSVFSF